MSSQKWKIAMAYVGVIVGAGLSSGQELMQYFVSFGKVGLIGVLVLAVLNIAFGKIIISLGSYYRSNNHSEVLSNIAHPIIHRILDASLIITCFVIGIVMLAGAGANLNQQFGLPVWLGSLICGCLIIGVSFFDFNQITRLIGVFTPLMLVMILVISVKTFVGQSYDFTHLNQIAQSLDRTMPNIWVSVINYFAVSIMMGVSMAFVLGGSLLNIDLAKQSGRLGGALIGLIVAVVTLILFVRVDILQGAEIPMLILAREVHPFFALLYALIIFGLIFNTSFSLDYALAKRFAGESPKKFRPILGAIVLISYVLSFLGFKRLVAIMYPILGYIGVLLVLILTYAWFNEKKAIKGEQRIRRRMSRIISKKFDDSKEFKMKDRKVYAKLGQASVIETKEIREDIHDFVEDQMSEMDD